MWRRRSRRLPDLRPDHAPGGRHLVTAAIADYLVACEPRPVKGAYEAMEETCGLPGDGESGLKLIRRSMARLARQRLGELDWIEGQIMLAIRR